MSEAGDIEEIPAKETEPGLPGLMEEWTAPKRSRRWLSDTQRYKQLGNAVCVPVIAELAAASGMPPTQEQQSEEGDSLLMP